MGSKSTSNTTGPEFNWVPKPKSNLFYRFVWHPSTYCGI